MIDTETRRILAQKIAEAIDRDVFNMFATAPIVVNGEQFTMEKVLEAKQKIDESGPISSRKIDLYGSPIIPARTCYLLGPELQPDWHRGRQVIVVPKSEIQEWASRLREAGADVRIEPVYGAQPLDEEGQCPTS